MPVLGPPTLERLCINRLVEFKAYLGDVGDLPVELLSEVLQVCSAEELAEIEDETRDGGRDIAADLAEHWRRCCMQDYGAALQVPGAAGPGQPRGWEEADWRELYELHRFSEDEKRRAVGQRLRGMWAADAQQRSSRSIQVINKVPLCARAGGGVRGGGAAQRPPSSRQRLLRKLGMGRRAPSRGAASGGALFRVPRRRGAPPAPRGPAAARAADAPRGLHSLRPAAADAGTAAADAGPAPGAREGAAPGALKRKAPELLGAAGLAAAARPVRRAAEPAAGGAPALRSPGAARSAGERRLLGAAAGAGSGCAPDTRYTLSSALAPPAPAELAARARGGSGGLGSSPKGVRDAAFYGGRHSGSKVAASIRPSSSRACHGRAPGGSASARQTPPVLVPSDFQW